MTPAQILYRLAGNPDPRKPVVDCASVCAMCADPIASGAKYSKVFSSSFTDQDLLASPQSTHVCVACTWACTGRPPDTLRLWTWVYRADRELAPSNTKAQPWAKGHVQATTKADVTEIAALLLDPPDCEWFTTIADSGQIHIVPFAVVNSGRRWRVKFERVDVVADSDEFGAVYAAANDCYQAGFVKEDLLTGRPHPSKLVKCGIDTWKAYHNRVAAHIGSPLLELAIWLLRRNK